MFSNRNKDGDQFIVVAAALITTGLFITGMIALGSTATIFAQQQQGQPDSVPKLPRQAQFDVLNCIDINKQNFPVGEQDPYGFDHDNDGIGCEPVQVAGVIVNQTIAAVAAGELSAEEGAEQIEESLEAVAGTEEAVETDRQK